MRIPFALKPLFGLLLPLLLLAGCMVPSTPSHVEPVTVQGGEPGTVRVSLRMPQAEYQTQHLVEDIESLVFGLVDVGSDPYFGYADGATFTAIGSNYHEAIAGDGTPASGLLSLPTLSDAQLADPSRYLYVATPNNGSRSMTFENVKPSETDRYVAFAVAFSKNAATTAVTADDAIGFVQSDPFKVADNGSTAVPPMVMTLNRGLGSAEIFLQINDSEHVTLSTMTKLVVGLMDASLTRTPYLGYESSASGTLKLTGGNPNPSYHWAIAGNGDATPFVPGAFNYANTPLEDHAERGNRERLLYHVSLPSGGPLPKTRTVTFSNLKPGEDYYAFAVVFQGGDVTAAATQSAAITVQANTTVSRNLEMNLGI